MPQIDKVTFLSLVFGLTVLYIAQYLILSISHLYIFVSTFKLTIKRIIYTLFYNKITRRIIRTILFFPWIFDVDEYKNFIKVIKNIKTNYIQRKFLRKAELQILLFKNMLTLHGAINNVTTMRYLLKEIFMTFTKFCSRSSTRSICILAGDQSYNEKKPYIYIAKIGDEKRLKNYKLPKDVYGFKTEFPFWGKKTTIESVSDIINYPLIQNMEPVELTHTLPVYRRYYKKVGDMECISTPEFNFTSSHDLNFCENFFNIENDLFSAAKFGPAFLLQLIIIFLTLGCWALICIHSNDKYGEKWDQFRKNISEVDKKYTGYYKREPENPYEDQETPLLDIFTGNNIYHRYPRKFNRGVLFLIWIHIVVLIWYCDVGRHIPWPPFIIICGLMAGISWLLFMSWRSWYITDMPWEPKSIEYTMDKLPFVIGCLIVLFLLYTNISFDKFLFVNICILSKLYWMDEGDQNMLFYYPWDDNNVYFYRWFLFSVFILLPVFVFLFEDIIPAWSLGIVGYKIGY